MNTPNGNELPLEQEIPQLRARIAQLEEAISRMLASSQELERHNDEALSEIELQYKEVFDNISVCMFLVDVTPDGRFKYGGFNPAEEKTVGLSNAEVSGKFVEEVFADGLAMKLSANYRRCLEAGTPIAYDDDLHLPGGRRNFHSNLIPIRNASGRIHRIVGACIDTTDFKRTQEEALARQKLESLGVLAGGIAHDFNNLLGGIHSEAELAEMDLAIGSAAREEIQRIKTAAIRGSEIVRELMIYAGESQKDLNEEVDLSRLVEEMLKLLKVSISKQVALRTDFREELPAVWGNAPQIRQMVMNLVLNASEAIGNTKGVITVTAAQVGAGCDLAQNNAMGLTGGDYVRIEVSDTGCGMTEEIKAKIFDPFFSTKFAGRGLGLAVVQGIVRDLDGAINIVSAPGQGTAFQVFLPSATKKGLEVHSRMTSDGLEKSDASARTILVVEDDQTLRRAVSIGLRKRGFSVLEASDGSVAIDLIHAHKEKIDVVLLDVTLTGGSSRDVFEEALRIRPDLKVIVTSAYDKGRVDTYYSGLRVNHFIRKPFRLDDLVRLSGAALSAEAR